MLFRKLRKQDLLLDGEDLDNMSDQELTKICFQRGININTSRKEQLASLKLWLSISLKANVPHTLLQLIRIHDFNQELFEVEEDETQDEILRRVSIFIEKYHFYILILTCLHFDIVQERCILH